MNNFLERIEKGYLDEVKKGLYDNDFKKYRYKKFDTVFDRSLDKIDGDILRREQMKKEKEVLKNKCIDFRRAFLDIIKMSEELFLNSYNVNNLYKSDRNKYRNISRHLAIELLGVTPFQTRWITGCQWTIPTMNNFHKRLSENIELSKEINDIKNLLTEKLK